MGAWAALLQQRLWSRISQRGISITLDQCGDRNDHAAAQPDRLRDGDVEPHGSLTTAEIDPAHVFSLQPLPIPAFASADHSSRTDDPELGPARRYSTDTTNEEWPDV